MATDTTTTSNTNVHGVTTRPKDTNITYQTARCQTTWRPWTTSLQATWRSAGKAGEAPISEQTYHSHLNINYQTPPRQATWNTHKNMRYQTTQSHKMSA
jgi:hypothetical protein